MKFLHYNDFKIQFYSLKIKTLTLEFFWTTYSNHQYNGCKSFKVHSLFYFLSLTTHLYPTQNPNWLRKHQNKVSRTTHKYAFDIGVI